MNTTHNADKNKHVPYIYIHKQQRERERDERGGIIIFKWLLTSLFYSRKGVGQTNFPVRPRSNPFILQPHYYMYFIYISMYVTPANRYDCSDAL